ncbi:hypothetical protein J3R82DRAFT_3693 [Butyriboletus roseoflavus]|nr:hypothetical protein J3R82DRAFT_3693 [Butyriboletus roseoflavus]
MSSLDNTYGAFLIGVVVSATLYGGVSQRIFISIPLNYQTPVTCIQTWYYYSRYPSDPWYIKLLVAGVLISDTCHQALITHSGKYTHPRPLYVYSSIPSLHLSRHRLRNGRCARGSCLESGYRSILQCMALDRLCRVPLAHHTYQGFTALFVQSFLAMRVYRHDTWSLVNSVSCILPAHHSRTNTVMPTVLILVYGINAYVSNSYFASLAFYSCTLSLNVKTFVQLASLKALSMSVNAVAAAGDVLIAAFLCSLLQMSRTGFRRSDTMINKLIVFSINTGLLTSICAVASLISIAAWPTTFIYIAFYFCLGRLYCNSLLATLNARKGLRGGSGSDEMSLSLQGVQQKTNSSMIGMSSRRAANNISIKIDTTQECVRDEYSAMSGDLKSPEVV